MQPLTLRWTMHRAAALGTALWFLGAAAVHAHPGHGATPPDSLRHYVCEPVHGLPLLLLVAAVVAVAALHQRQRR